MGSGSTRSDRGGKPSHQLRLPTRKPVSSEQITLPEVADGGAGRREAFARLGENVNQGSFADVEAEHVLSGATGADYEGDALGEAQINDESPEVGDERRAGLQPRRGLGLETPRAARADAPMQAHPGDLGGDRRNLDAVIDLASLLRALRDVGPAAVAHARQDVALMLRIGMQRPMCARMRLLCLRRLFTNSVVLWPWTRRDARVVRRLRRTIRFGLQIGRSPPQAPPPSRSTARSPPPAPRRRQPPLPNPANQTPRNSSHAGIEPKNTVSNSAPNPSTTQGA